MSKKNSRRKERREEVWFGDLITEESALRHVFVAGSIGSGKTQCGLIAVIERFITGFTAPCDELKAEGGSK